MINFKNILYTHGVTKIANSNIENEIIMHVMPNSSR